MIIHKHQHAFSLVELSIVLVILGLLVGGILAGQSLIRAAELRKVTTDIENLKTAIMVFRGKYFALPGDMSNATSFWGDRATGTEACADAAIADGTPGTCNGNDNGVLGLVGTENLEYVLAWQHLTLAGLVPGTYNGISPTLTPGINVPRTSLGNNSLYWLAHTHTYGRYGNIIILGGATGQAWGPVLAPEEAWNIDVKTDDGDPFRGNTRTWNGYTAGVFPTTGCVLTGTRTSSVPVVYDFSITTRSCAITFYMPF